jgi:hypothetical protein
MKPMRVKHRINRPVIDVRDAPNRRGERINQLLFNELAVQLVARGNHLRVRSVDGYAGWVRKDQLSPTVPGRHPHFVDVPFVSLIEEKTGRFVGKLSFGTPVTLLEKSESFGRIDFSGIPAWLSLGCVRRYARRKSKWSTVKP